VHNKAFHALKRAASYFNSRTAKPHRRGAFHSIAHGVSFGGGQEVSVTDYFCNLSNRQHRSLGPYSHPKRKRADDILNWLMERSAIQRICKHASGKQHPLTLSPIAVLKPMLVLEGFRIYGRQNYEYVKKTVEDIRKELPAFDNPMTKRSGLPNPLIQPWGHRQRHPLTKTSPTSHRPGARSQQSAILTRNSEGISCSRRSRPCCGVSTLLHNPHPLSTHNSL
jgi:hypothetical protein